MSATKPQVFIIESLKFKDEDQDKFEGHRISQMLALSGKECRYMYFRTKTELEAILDRFWESRYRYLHLSCHAGRESLDTTLDTISFKELVQILEPYLERRRLFLSACEMSCRKLADELLPRTQCFSMLGPSAKVDAADAAVFWAAFYHKMFRINSESMNTRQVLDTATTFSEAFSIPLNLFAQKGSKFEFCRIRPRSNK